MRGRLMTSTNAAADAARTRAAECHRRVAQLAQGQPVGADDVRRAQGSLRQAGQRAARARRRLANRQLLGAGFAPLRVEEPDAPALRSDEPDAPALRSDEPDAPALRERARHLARWALFEAYFALGGVCTAFELDAFVYAALELPRHELSVIDQAIWELTEL
jgi:hypothetical protein